MAGTAVFLETRVVLAPPLKDKKGLIVGKNPIEDREWMALIEFEMGPDADTLEKKKAKPLMMNMQTSSALTIFYVENPDISAVEETHYGYSAKFRGAGVVFNSQFRNKNKKEKGGPL